MEFRGVLPQHVEGGLGVPQEGIDWLKSLLTYEHECDGLVFEIVGFGDSLVRRSHHIWQGMIDGITHLYWRAWKKLTYFRDSILFSLVMYCKGRFEQRNPPKGGRRCSRISKVATRATSQSICTDYDESIALFQLLTILDLLSQLQRRCS